MILKDARGHKVCTKLSVFPSVKFTKITTKGPLEVLKVDGVLSLIILSRSSLNFS